MRGWAPPRGEGLGPDRDPPHSPSPAQGRLGQAAQGPPPASGPQGGSPSEDTVGPRKWSPPAVPSLAPLPGDGRGRRRGVAGSLRLSSSLSRPTAPGPPPSRGERSFFEGRPLLAPNSPPFTVHFLQFDACPPPPALPCPTPNPLETEETATRSEPPDTLALPRGSPLPALASVGRGWGGVSPPPTVIPNPLLPHRLF